MNPIKNENGFQLLEILLSISLLFIVLLVFFGIFLQSKNFSIQNHKSGSASQLSQEILQKVRESNLTSDDSLYSPQITKENWEESNLAPEKWAALNIEGTISGGEFIISLDNQIYYPKVKIMNADQYSTMFSIPKRLPAQLDIIVVEIFVKKGSKLINTYETYGYKERE